MPTRDKEKRKEYNKLYYQRNKCEHNKSRFYCVTCAGSAICEHKKRRSRCIECDGTEICEHKKVIYFCKECKD